MVSSEQSASSRFPRIISCFSWHFLHISRLFFQELILPLCQSHRAHRYVALFNLLVTNGHWTDYVNKSDTPRLFFPTSLHLALFFTHISSCHMQPCPSAWQFLPAVLPVPARHQAASAAAGGSAAGAGWCTEPRWDHGLTAGSGLRRQNKACGCTLCKCSFTHEDSSERKEHFFAI